MPLNYTFFRAALIQRTQIWCKIQVLPFEKNKDSAFRCYIFRKLYSQSDNISCLGTHLICFYCKKSVNKCGCIAFAQLGLYYSETLHIISMYNYITIFFHFYSKMSRFCIIYSFVNSGCNIPIATLRRYATADTEYLRKTIKSAVLLYVAKQPLSSYSVVKSKLLIAVDVSVDGRKNRHPIQKKSTLFYFNIFNIQFLLIFIYLFSENYPAMNFKQYKRKVMDITIFVKNFSCFFKRRNFKLNKANNSVQNLWYSYFFPLATLVISGTDELLFHIT